MLMSVAGGGCIVLPKRLLASQGCFPLDFLVRIFTVPGARDRVAVWHESTAQLVGAPVPGLCSNPGAKVSLGVNCYSSLIHNISIDPLNPLGHLYTIFL